MEKNGVKYDLSEGVTVEELDESLIADFELSQRGFKRGFVRFQPYGQVLPRSYAKYERILKEFPIKDDDIWISSFPKCGTTWTEEMVWCMMNNLDFESAKEKILDERIPYIELLGISSPDTDDPTTFPDTIKAAAELEGRRIIKTHLSVDMLPREIMEKKIKLIYVARNPRDVCVSYFNHWKILEGYHGTFEVFVKAFLDDVCGYYTPFLDHVKDYWELQKTNKNVLFVFYEDMKKDLPSVIRRVSAFLERPVSEDDVSVLASHLSFDRMKNNSSVNKRELVADCNKHYNNDAPDNAFMRQGKSGNWKQHLSEEQVRRFQEWERRGLEGTDLNFTFE